MSFKLGISRYVSVIRFFSSESMPAHTNDSQTTVNLKKVELPVKQIVSGKKIKASGTLANPESLKYYEQFANVEEVLAQTKDEVVSQTKSKL
jgi:acetoacetyl-CoA synthetase